MAEQTPLPAFGSEPRNLELIVSGKPLTRVTSAAEVIAVFRAVEDGTEEFIILAAGEQYYVQSAARGEGFLIEWRDGSEDRHFSAVATAIEGEELSARGALELLLVYAHGAPWPDTVTWIPRFGL